MSTDCSGIACSCYGCCDLTRYIDWTQNDHSKSICKSNNRFCWLKWKQMCNWHDKRYGQLKTQCHWSVWYLMSWASSFLLLASLYIAFNWSASLHLLVRHSYEFYYIAAGPSSRQCSVMCGICTAHSHMICSEKGRPIRSCGYAKWVLSIWRWRSVNLVALDRTLLTDKHSSFVLDILRYPIYQEWS